MDENVVIASDETWTSIFKKNKLAGAYYYEGEPKFNRLSVMAKVSPEAIRPRAGDCESTNTKIRHHYYIMVDNGELERKMFSLKGLKNDGRPPIPKASPSGSSCASSASPVEWRRKHKNAYLQSNAQGNVGAAAAPLLTFTRLFFPRESSHTLQIPERFVVQLDTPLPRICSIENHHGAVWSAIFETIDGKHYFTQGWFHFARDNALRQGDLLIFTYERHGFFSLRQYWAGTRFPPFDLAEALGPGYDEINTSDDDGVVSGSQDVNEVAP
ncbi:B3 domain-containing protein REM20-like [Salvia divinorum]|uniref:B3 domain-containing protein REM20-like n=1 Tax=Salvia divinorum TaxID=28513 RepID=A0ABD1GJI4_SALDI